MEGAFDLKACIILSCLPHDCISIVLETQVQTWVLVVSKNTSGRFLLGSKSFLTSLLWSNLLCLLSLTDC